MADGRNIEIKIAAIGADQAATELRKVEAAGRELDQSHVQIIDTTKKNTAAIEENKKALAEWQAQRNAARTGGSQLASDPAEFLEEEAAATRKLEEAKRAEAAAQREATRAKEEARAAAARLKEEQRRLAQATREANAALSNKRRGIEALNSALSNTVGGTGAVGTGLRALLNPYAAVGALIGGIVGLLTKWIGKSKELDEQESKALEAAKKRYEELLKARSQMDLSSALKGNADYLQALDDEFDSQKKLNDEIARKIELIQRERLLQTERISSEAAVELAKIDANKTMSEADKIVARSVVQDKVDQRVRDDRKFSAETTATKAENEATTARLEQAGVQASIDGAKKLLAENERESAELIGKVIADRNARASIDALNAEIAKAQKDMPNPQDPRFVERETERVERIKNLEAERERLVSRPQTSSAEVRRLNNLLGVVAEDPNAKLKAQDGGVISNTKKKIQELEMELKKISGTVETRAAIAREQRGLAEMEKTAADERYADRRKVSGIESVSAVDTAIERERNKREAKEASDRKKRARRADQLDDQGEGIADNIITSARGAKSLSPKYREDVRRRVMRLRDGLQEGDTEDITKLIDDMLATMRQFAEGNSSQAQNLEKQKRELADLKNKFNQYVRASGK